MFVKYKGKRFLIKNHILGKWQVHAQVMAAVCTSIPWQACSKRNEYGAWERPQLRWPCSGATAQAGALLSAGPNSSLETAFPRVVHGIDGLLPAMPLGALGIPAPSVNPSSRLPAKTTWVPYPLPGKPLRGEGVPCFSSPTDADSPSWIRGLEYAWF